jgi:formate C-acetyltransferase
MIVAEKILAEEHLFPLASATCKGPIEKGLDVSQGGAAVNVGPVFAAIGIADAANSLAAIKKLIYEDKVCTWDELKAALEADWEGYEELRQKALACPKYGNDDDYVDLLIAKFLDWYCYEVKNLKLYRGQYADATIQMVQANVAFGNMTGTSPYGRKAKTPLADTISAKAGTDVKGPTAAARSYGKLNHSAFNNGTICNMWISRSELIEE